MKIILLNNLYAPYNKGGAERIVEIMNRELKDLGHETIIITSAPKTYRWDNIYYLKSPYHHLNTWPKILRFFWQLINIFNLHKYFQIKKILKDEQPDLIIAHNLMGLGWLIPQLIKRQKIRYIQILHDIQLLHPSGLMYYNQEKNINSWLARIYQFLTKKLFNQPDLVVSPSKWLLELYEQKTFFINSKKTVLRNPQPITATNHELKSSEQPEIFKFLYVGQIEDHKGIIFLATAFIETLNKNLRLTIVGSGSQEPQLQEIIKDDQRIEFIGKKDTNEVQELMATHHAIIVPSLCYENSPTVIYEAANNNLPILASNLGGIPELIQEFGGILFAPNNLTDLISKIELMVENYQQFKSNSPRQLDTKKYSQKLLEL